MLPNAEVRLAPGRIIAGLYRIEQEIGRGGFGVVFRATQLNIGREVALKIVVPRFATSADVLARLEREAELAKRLEHPNTVRLYDFGRTEEGVPYLVWELLRGEPLDVVLRRGQPLPADRVARIASYVLASLMEAHAKSILHRDLKPSNIVLCNFSGSPDFAKVLDFGIGKLLQPEAGAPQLTREGEMLGTPLYMAPEQILGQPLGPATDLYAVGLVMAEAISGAPPFQFNGLQQLVAEKLAATPPPSLAAALRSPLGAVIERAIRRDPAARFSSAEEMLRAIEQVMRSGEAATVAQLPVATQTAGVGYMQTAVAVQAISAAGPLHTPGSPPMPPPAAPAPAPAGGGAGRTIAFIAGGLGLFLLGGAAALYVVIVRAEAAAAAYAQPVDNKPKEPITLTPEQVEQRLKELGWTIKTTTGLINIGGDLTLGLGVEKRGISGGVNVYVVKTSADAAIDLAKIPSNGGDAKAVEGRTELYVSVGPNGARNSPELLAAILARKR